MAGHHDRQPARLVRQWLSRLRHIRETNFEQAHVVGAAQIALGDFQHARQHALPHHDALAADRILQANVILHRAEQRRFLLRHRQSVTDDFLQAAIHQNVAHLLLEDDRLIRLLFRQRLRQQRRRHAIVAKDAHDVLDEIGGPFLHVEPMRRHGNLVPVRARRLDLVFQSLQNAQRLRGFDLEAEQAIHLFRLELDHLRRPRRGIAIDQPGAHAAAGVLPHQVGGALDGGLDRFGMDAAAEADAGLARQIEMAERAANADEIEARRFE